MGRMRLGFMLFFTTLLWAALPSEDTFALHQCKEWIAKVVSVQGIVEAQRIGETRKRPVSLNDTYCRGDTILVRKLSRAAFQLRNDSIVRLNELTVLTFARVKEEKTFLLELLRGAAHFISRTPRTLEVTTPFVNAGVEGTEFLITVTGDQTVVTVYEGRVMTANSDGSLVLGSGQSGVTQQDQPPALFAVARPRDAVQWALYYPPVLDYDREDFPGDTDTGWHAMLKRSIRSYRDGDLINAFSSIRDVPEEVRDPRFFNYRASLLLFVGRTQEAQKDIERAVTIAPGDSDSIALQSIIALVQNKKEEALGLAQKAIDSDGDSAAARIALSYALQADFDLEGALENVEEAIVLDPGNALARARLSELQLSLGELEDALESARKAVELNPNLSRTQSVLGFAYLTQIKIDASISAFERAVALDQADPLPRLGIGLAKIRMGELKAGREEIEIAAGLDPGNSLIRSYVGKAYYEEKRDRVAASQLAMAKGLDPADPTPFLYDAIRKQTANRPVEALHAMQKSIELNDNRAIYRSKLSLDQDLATRSAALARIYGDLGFQQLALVEGWKSVNVDPANYSAHRFLADSYSSLPHHEIARVSELLQSQLLQPINITPVQPELAEGNLFILSGAGPGTPSFNEFNPLFNRNRIALQVNGIVGDNGTWGENLIVSGVHDTLSFSAGQFHYETDGFRDNNDQEQDIYNVFVQMTPWHKTTVLAELRYKDAEEGDLPLRFDPDNMSPNLRQEEETTSIRFGLRQSLTTRSDIIATIIYKDLDTALRDRLVTEIVLPPPIPPMTVTTDVDLSSDDDGYMAEVQHLFRGSKFHIISGAGHFTGDRRNIVTFSPAPPQVNDVGVEHTNFYLYSQINYPENMTWTLGGSADIFDGDILDETGADPNPKLGLTWNPRPSTTLRAAAFKVFNRTLISSQTLEPTQVAGFNQFFDDGEGTESWRYGIALDEKFSDDLYGGVEFSKRDLEVFFRFAAPPPAVPEVRHVDWEEKRGTAYLYWTPYSWLAAGAEYQYERLVRDSEFIGEDEILVSETHKLPFGVSVYDPSGFFARLRTTYVRQRGTFDDPPSDGRDDFWVVDTSVGYRLPKRLGIMTLGVRNLFDESIHFQDTDPATPVVYPERFVFAKFTLAL